ncbi:hypothetical protein GCM10009087_09130 [Sphingomonas oligophenolica]|uniref:Uncharacterized protein n=1 Tax=Sphingomonas oligophenolica TaxID=301154 RepID=A0ABU9XY22_9SPHN
MYKFAVLGIKPVKGLNNTADIIGEIFGHIQFHRDEDFIFDEFPAYIAKDDTYRYALLGIPESPGHDDGESKNVFQFEMRSLDRDNTNGHINMSEEIAEKLNSDGRLFCWT